MIQYWDNRQQTDIWLVTTLTLMTLQTDNELQCWNARLEYLREIWNAQLVTAWCWGLVRLPSSLAVVACQSVLPTQCTVVGIRWVSTQGYTASWWQADSQHGQQEDAIPAKTKTSNISEPGKYLSARFWARESLHLETDTEFQCRSQEE